MAEPIFPSQVREEWFPLTTSLLTKDSVMRSAFEQYSKKGLGASQGFHTGELSAMLKANQDTAVIVGLGNDSVSRTP